VGTEQEACSWASLQAAAAAAAVGAEDEEDVHPHSIAEVDTVLEDVLEESEVASDHAPSYLEGARELWRRLDLPQSLPRLLLGRRRMMLQISGLCWKVQVWGSEP